MNPNLLSVLAGRKARAIIEDGGLSMDRVRVLAAASGGPKWLVLSQIDRVLCQLLKERRTPLYGVGSSVGSWRLAAHAMPDSPAAFDALEHAYVHQRYKGHPSVQEVSAVARDMMNAFLPPGTDAPLHHPWLKFAWVAVRSRGPGASPLRVAQMLHLLGAGLGNAVSRRALNLFFERAVFFSPGFEQGLIGADQLRTHWYPLEQANLHPALLASGSIPLVLDAVRDIPGARPGAYYDGGISDYHLNLNYRLGDDEIILMPHFYPHITPGWFDKALKYRKPRTAWLDNLVLISPSPSFVASLPGGTIPDRKDFERFYERDEARIAQWNEVIRRCEALAEAFAALMSGKPVAAGALN
ncbi:patatin-like phospholipase family protein [Granulosicoccaceae sp. 1_MG-2023]|nr:patatin-like phospholipase family protein [Granulosicoccaceae sp. 1_MG-2023]